MEENSEIINEKLSKIAMLSEGIAQLFDGKTSTLVALKEPEFKQWCKIFSKLNVDSNTYIYIYTLLQICPIYKSRIHFCFHEN